MSVSTVSLQIRLMGQLPGGRWCLALWQQLTSSTMSPQLRGRITHHLNARSRANWFCLQFLFKTCLARGSTWAPAVQSKSCFSWLFLGLQPWLWFHISYRPRIELIYDDNNILWNQIRKFNKFLIIHKSH